MDPTTAIPLHFTLETVTLSAAGLLLAWSALRRRWTASAASAALVVAQGLHAGRFLLEDDPWLLVLRVAAIVGLAASVVPMDIGRVLFGSGLLGLAVATLWGGLSGGGADGDALNVVIGPHLFGLLGSVVLIAWVWQAARPSVRMRVLAAFISVLAVTVIVAGGAVARVASVNSRSEQFSRLSLHAATVRRSVINDRDFLRGRASALSPTLSTGLVRGRPSLDRARLLEGEWAVAFDRSNVAVVRVAAVGARIPYARGALGALAPVATARQGDIGSATDVIADGLVVVAAAPIYRPGGARVARDVVGVIAIGVLRRPAELKHAAAEPGVELALVDADASASTRANIEIPAPVTRDGESVALQTIQVDGEGDNEDRLAVAVPLPEGTGRVVVTTPLAVVIGSATDLVRAFLIAILTAAMLAVVAALWLSSRIARPMLDLADEAERVKRDFLSSLSHELRTPLTPIRGYTEILRRGRVPARDAGGYLDEIGSAALRLERIIALLLDVAAIEAGRFRIDTDTLSPDELLGAARDRRDEPRQNITVSVSRSLPMIVADPSAIGRVLDELLDNAIKFAPDGAIELRARRSGDRVELAVTDGGPGIDAMRVEALRGAFTQADTGDTRRYGGLGLGLAFSEGVLAAHGSVLEIATAPGKGTTCSFTLPTASRVTRMPVRTTSRHR